MKSETPNISPTHPAVTIQHGKLPSGEGLETLESQAEALSDRPKDECGVVGVSMPGNEVARLIYFGLFALQHRGQESAGMASTDGHGLTVHKQLGLVSQVFQEEETINLLRGSMGIGHVRYSTTGSTTERNAQPLLAVASQLPGKPQLMLDNPGERRSEQPVRYIKDAEMALAHNGNIVNALQLRESLKSQGYQFETTTDTEAMVYLIQHHLGTAHAAMASGPAMLKAIKKALVEVKGAYALVILTPNYLIGARDPRGIRPLVLGSLGGPGHVFASETCALDMMGAKLIREVGPGEIVLVDSTGRPPVSVSLPGTKNAKPALCVFETVYFARPDSEFDGLVIEDARERMGAILAREHPVDVDFVVPIPDSGIPAALGYAGALGAKYVPGLIKNRYVLRTFIQPDQQLRDQGIRLKLNPLRKRIFGKRIALVDDSIVRGTTTRQIVRLMKDAGAREVHVRVSCPPIRWPCFYGIDTSIRTDLIASGMSLNKIRQYIGADSLEYLSHKGLMEAVAGDKPRRYCDACLTGHYPVQIPKGTPLAKLVLEEPL